MDYTPLLQARTGHELLAAIRAGAYSLQSPGMLDFIVLHNQQHLLQLLMNKEIKKDVLIQLLSLIFRHNAAQLLNYIFGKFSRAQLIPIFTEIYQNKALRPMLYHRHLYNYLPFLELMTEVLRSEAEKKRAEALIAEKRQQLLHAVILNDDATYLSYLNDIANIYSPAVMTAAIQANAEHCKQKLLDYGADMLREHKYQEILQKLNKN